MLPHFCNAKVFAVLLQVVLVPSDQGWGFASGLIVSRQAISYNVAVGYWLLLNVCVWTVCVDSTLPMDPLSVDARWRCNKRTATTGSAVCMINKIHSSIRAYRSSPACLQAIVADAPTMFRPQLLAPMLSMQTLHAEVHELCATRANRSVMLTTCKCC